MANTLAHPWINALYQFIWGTGPRKVITAFILTRLFIFAVGIRSMQFLPKFEGMPVFGHSFIVDMWLRWDAGWYLTIAGAGYEYIPGQISSTGYFPLYPLLMRATSIFADAAVTGIIISNCALILAVIVLYRLLKLDFDSQLSARTILYMLVFPASFFLSGVHTEATFLLMTVSSFYAARKNNWALAGLFGALAALTRSTGILILPALLIEYVYQNGIRHWRDLPKIKREIMWLGLIPLATLSFAGYLYLQFGTPFAYINNQLATNSATFPFSVLLNTLIIPDQLSIIGAPFMLLSIFLLISAWKTTRFSYLAYASLILLFNLSTVGTYAAYRYMSTLFPLFLILAQITQNRPSLHHSIVWISALSLAVFMSLFVRGWLLP